MLEELLEDANFVFVALVLVPIPLLLVLVSIVDELIEKITGDDGR